MKLLGIHGKKRSGKDTVGKMVQDFFPQMQLIAFANHLKRICSVTFGVAEHEFHNEDLKEQCPPGHHITRREMMTMMGPAIYNTFGREFFVKHVDKHWQMSKESGLIVTDVRHEWEAAWVRMEGGMILHLDRETITPIGQPDISEAGIKRHDGDYTIENNGTIWQLQASVHEFCKWWVGPF